MQQKLMALVRRWPFSAHPLGNHESFLKYNSLHLAIVITFYNHYVNIAVLTHIPLITMGQFTFRPSSARSLIKKEEGLAS